MVIGIDYNEVSQDSYQAVTLYLGRGEEELRFASGFPDIDLLRAFFWVWDKGLAELVCFSSSVDHFCSDGEGYYWAQEMGGEFLVRNGMHLFDLLKLAKPYIDQDREDRKNG